MSVKKMGSKLVQGVRQIKAQQEASPAEKPVGAPVVPVAKAAPARAAAKPAPTKTSEPSTPHPKRVWPD